MLFDFSDNPTLREIAAALEQVEPMDGFAVDKETGEVIPPALWDELTAKRDEKIRAYIAVIKDLRARAKTHAEEAKAQKARAETLTKKAEYLAGILETVLDGETVDAVEGRVSYRMTSGAVKITDAGKIPAEWVERMEPVFSKDKMRDYLKMGGVIDGAEWVKERRMYIK